MTIDTGTSNPISTKTLPHSYEALQWVKDEKEKLLAATVIHNTRSSWSAPIIVVPNCNEGKCLVYRL